MNKIVLIALSTIVISTSQAQEKQSSSFSLQEAIDYSLKNSPNYLNADLDLQNANYKRKEVAGLGFPQITGSVDLKDYINLPTSLLPGQFLEHLQALISL